MASKVPLPVVLTGAALIASAFLIRFFPQHLPARPLLPVFLGLFAIESVTAIIYFVFIYPFFVTPLRHLPQPKGGNIILGYGSLMLEKPRGKTFLRWLRDIPNHGLIYFRGYFNGNRLLVTNHETLKELLVTKAYDFEKPAPLRNVLRDVLGDGLIIVEGDDHAFLRKNIMPAFNFRHIKDLYPVFWDKSVEMTQAVAQQLAKDPGDSIEINHWANQVTMDIIGLAAMGRDFQCLKAGGRHPLIDHYEEILEPTFGKQIYFIARILGPGELIKRLPTAFEKRMSNIIGQLTDLCLQLVRDKRATVAEEKAGSKESSVVNRDILGLLVRSGNFSDRQLVDQMLTFLAAGHETTSSTLTWTTYLLAKHPEIQTALRKEIYANLPSPSDPLPPSFDLAATLESLPLLNGVCNEASRLYPTVPITTRLANKPTSLAGQPIPAGTQIAVVPWATNRDPSMWGSDADAFNPDRWIDQDSKTGKPRPNNSGGAASNYAFLTFLHGPRSCIGQNFARAELRCLVAAFVGRFEMALARPEEKVLPAGVVTLKPENGMHLLLKNAEGWGS